MEEQQNEERMRRLEEEANSRTAPPAVQHVPGSQGSEYVSPNTTKGTPKKDQSEVEAARKRDELTPDPPQED
jgi:hypothetical protein